MKNMVKTTKEVKIICIALLIISLSESCAIFLRPFLSAVTTIALIRSAQIISLILFLRIIPGGLEFTGLLQENFYQGIKTGLIWSLIFGIIVAFTGGVLLLTDIKPYKFFHLNDIQGSFIFLFLTLNFLGPITEEIIFRGIIYSFLKKFGIITAITLSTIIFALFHFSSSSFLLFQIAGGFVFALSFEYSKSAS